MLTHVLPLGAVALGCLLTLSTATAQAPQAGKHPQPPPPPVPTTYRVDLVDLPALGDRERQMSFVALTQHQALAAIANGADVFSARVSRDLEVTPVTCAPNEGEHPLVTDMNTHLTVVGYSRDGGLVQTVDGTCTFFTVDGQTTTLLAIADTGTSLGQYFEDADVVPGLLRIKTFVRTPDGTITPLTALGVPANSVLNVAGTNRLGDVVGYGLLNIQRDNSYTHQAFYLPADGEVRYLNGPAGEDLYCGGLSNRRQAVCNAPGGAVPWIYDYGTDQLYPFPTEGLTPFASSYAGVSN